MVRPKSELAEIAVHVLCRHVNVGRANRILEQLPEALNVIGRLGHTSPIIVDRPFLGGMLDRAMGVPVAGR